MSMMMIMISMIKLLNIDLGWWWWDTSITSGPKKPFLKSEKVPQVQNYT